MEMISVPPWTADTEHWLLFSLCSYLNNIFFCWVLSKHHLPPTEKNGGMNFLVQSLGGDKGENLPEKTSLGAQPDTGSEGVKQQKVLPAVGKTWLILTLSRSAKTTSKFLNK